MNKVDFKDILANMEEEWVNKSIYEGKMAAFCSK